jgi:hypothetical protein
MRVAKAPEQDGLPQHEIFGTRTAWSRFLNAVKAAAETFPRPSSLAKKTEPSVDEGMPAVARTPGTGIGYSHQKPISRQKGA